MAKHKYSHDEIMYECETCGWGFTFKSQIRLRIIESTWKYKVMFASKLIVVNGSNMSLSLTLTWRPIPLNQ